MAQVRYGILDSQFTDNTCVLKVRLELPGWGSVEAYGVGSGSPAEAYREACKNAVETCFELAETINTRRMLLQEDTEPAEAPVEAEVSEENDGWNPQDVKRLKELKKRLGITENEQLNKYVREFSLGQLSDYLDITPDNIKSFCDYLESLLKEGEAA